MGSRAARTGSVALRGDPASEWEVRSFVEGHTACSLWGQIQPKHSGPLRPFPQLGCSATCPGVRSDFWQLLCAGSLHSFGLFECLSARLGY